MQPAYESSAGNAATNCLFAPPRERFAVLAIGGRHVEVECAQQHPAPVLDLVSFAPLDEQEPAGRQPSPFACHRRGASALQHKQPLGGAAVTVGGTALGAAGLDHHFRRFGPAVTPMNAKALAEGQVFEFHATSSATRIPGMILAREGHHFGGHMERIEKTFEIDVPVRTVTTSGRNLRTS